MGGEGERRGRKEERVELTRDLSSERDEEASAFESLKAAGEKRIRTNRRLNFAGRSAALSGMWRSPITRTSMAERKGDGRRERRRAEAGGKGPRSQGLGCRAEDKSEERFPR